MELFEKRNFVFLMAMFLLFMMVSSVNAIDAEDAVIGDDSAIEDLNLISSDTGEISVGNAGSDNSVLYPVDDDSLSTGDADEKLSSDLIADEDSAVAPRDTKEKLSMENTVDDSSQNALKASSEGDDILGADHTYYVGPQEVYTTLQAAINACTSMYDTYEIVIREGTYTGDGNRNVYVRRNSLFSYDFKDLIIRAEEGAKVIFDGQNRYTIMEINSPNVHIQGITFINAKPTENASGVCVDIHHNHISIDNCNFTNNGNNIIWGGAVHVDRYLHDINITNSYFENNIADVGGAIRSELDSYDINIINTTFIGNKAITHGGVACLFGEYSLIDNCYFENNTAPSSGAVHFHNGHSVVNNCTFVGNTATGGDRQSGYAGAVGLVYTDNSGVTINNSNFYNNTAVSDGGAIQIIGGGRNAHIYNSEFVDNAALYGGAISVVGQSTIIENVSLSNNLAINGSAVYVEGSGTTINNANLTNNTAVLEGGAMFVKGDNCHITNAAFTDNAAGDDGGAIYWEGNNGIVDKVICTNNTGTSATGNSKGGAICLTGSRVNITDSTFDSNSVINSDATDGGALFITGNNVNVANCNFTNNNASRYGGAAQIVGNNTNITNCNFEENNALPNENKKDDGLGGAVYMAGANGHVTGSNFTHNTARNGSAIYVNPSGSGINYIDNCDFDENQAWVYWLPIVYDEATHKIETNLTGGNNIINAIYNNGSRSQLRIDGRIPADGWENSQGGTVPYQDDLEADQEIIVTVYDRNGGVVYGPVTKITNLSGSISIDVSPEDTTNWFIINMTHTEDPYYKHITNITAINIKPGITVSNVTMYQGDETPQKVEVDVVDDNSSPIADALVDVYVIVDGKEIPIGSGQTTSAGVLVISESTVFKTLDPGNYTLKANYTYEYYNATTGKIENKTVVGNGNLEVLPIVELEITKVVDESKVSVGQNITFTITVTNKGPSNATHIVITDVLDEAFNYVSSTNNGKYNKDTRTVTWEIENPIAADGTVVVTVTVTVLKEGTFNNSASVVSNENDTKTNDTINITSEYNVVLDIVKEASEYEVVVGDEITFTINVTNNGLSNATEVVIYDILPEGFEYVSGADNYDSATRNVTWSIDKLEGNGGSKTVTFIVKAAVEGEYANVAFTHAKENETDVDDSTDVITILPDVSLSITKVANVTEVKVGDTVEFTITVTNNGLSRATEVIVYDVLPKGFEYVSGADKYDSATRNVTWNIDRIDKGGSATVTFIAEVVSSGELVNVAYTHAKENETDVPGTSDNITADKLHLTITVKNYVTYPGTDVTVEITVVDEKGNPFTGTLHVVVADPVSTDSLPPHTVGATADDILGATTLDVDITNGEGSFTYSVPDDAEDGTTYEVTATSDETDKYYAAEGNGYIDIIKLQTNTTVSKASGAPGEKVTLDVEVTTEDGEPFNGKVTVNGPDGFSTTVTIKDGKGSFDWTIPKDAENGTEYEFTATFDGNSKYFGSNGTGFVDVLTKDDKKDDDDNKTDGDDNETDDGPSDEPSDEPVVEDNTEKSTPVLKTGNPLVVLLVAMVFLGLGFKRREDE